MPQARYSQRWWFAVLAIAAAGLLAAQRPVAAQQPASPERPTILGSPFQFPQLTYDCGSIDPALTVSLKVTRTECPMTPVWSPWFDTESIKGEGLLATFNSEGAVVAIHETAYGNTLSFSGTIDHTGHQDDTIFWGLWHRGTYNLTVGHSPTGGAVPSLTTATRSPTSLESIRG